MTQPSMQARLDLVQAVSFGTAAAVYDKCADEISPVAAELFRSGDNRLINVVREWREVADHFRGDGGN